MKYYFTALGFLITGIIVAIMSGNAENMTYITVLKGILVTLLVCSAFDIVDRIRNNK